MTRVQAGDVVFSFCDSLIKAVGVARGGAESAPKPAEFGERGSYWGKEGWLVPVDFVEIDSPIRPKDHIEVLRPTLPARYSPLQANGDGLQSVYLAEVPDPMAGVLRSLLKGQAENVVEGYRSRLDPQAEDDAAEQALQADPNITATEKEQLIKARRGQGLYRSRLDTIETTCRITGLSQRAHLRASHIKPWRLSTNSEKLDGNNGLLLSPHIDHLFDRGFISFANDGRMLVSHGQAAEGQYHRGMELACKLEMRPLVAHCHLGLGKLYRRTDKREQAQEHLATATTMYREMGMTYWLEKAETAMTD